VVADFPILRIAANFDADLLLFLFLNVRVLPASSSLALAISTLLSKYDFAFNLLLAIFASLPADFK
jgi:predicted membrane-bound dolichyl-phosphate-mannose-protein mannosyltransferase